MADDTRAEASAPSSGEAATQKALTEEALAETEAEATDEAEIDFDALCAAYDRGLAAEKAGDVETAAAAYRDLLAIDPFDRVGASVRLACLGRGAAPEKAPDAYVAALFDQHAEVFDSLLVEQLGYDAPLQLRDLVAALGAQDGPQRFARMLDLGCGTGLAAEAFEDRADWRVGVDISEEMIAVAGEKDVYSALYVGEVVAFLKSAAESEAPFDLVVATDVLPYIGDLSALFEGVAARLAPGGLFGFSTETLPEAAFAGAGYKVGPKHRFAHQTSYIEATLAANAVDPLRSETIIVRYDEGAPIHGHLIVAARRGT